MMGTHLEYILWRCWHMVERQNDQALALWIKQLGWLCVCKHALRCIYSLDLKTGGQMKNEKWNSFVLMRGLKQENVWLWKWCCSCYEILLSFLWAFWMCLYRLMRFPETCSSLMWTLLIPGLICAVLAQRGHFPMLFRPPIAGDLS